MMGDGIRMDPKWWNGKSEDGKCRTYLIYHLLWDAFHGHGIC